VNLAFITEDLTDDIALGHLVSRCDIRHQQTRYQGGVGFGVVLKNAPPLVRQAARARCRGAIVAVDCDETSDHFEPDHVASTCRRCRLTTTLPPLHELQRLSSGDFSLIVTVPVRTLESWLAVLAEIAIAGPINTFGKTRRERLELKRLVYGTSTPTAETMQRRSHDLCPLADVDQLARTSRSFADFRVQLASLRSTRGEDAPS
jgi:hypothetical protein